ncbi:snf5-domain-containing protein [Ophiostoma piceae UAMH 11346]|uniref:Snf5-domain-containing protein n=1 Tax=Ophiostoma piceae (strain UAMH 11346) TaxID=1262450 RepID=S3C876_OPHP1|nr:snf5-domain-containing protein [Ophiostoma piceae UAMH 11346]
MASSASSTAPAVPQGFWTSYAARLRAYNNSMLVPVNPSAPLVPKTTKRGTTIINYAEDGYDDLDDDDDDTRRRPTSLRNLRRGDDAARTAAAGGPGASTPGAADLADRVGKETSEPVEVQGVWRDWQGKTRIPRSDLANYAQACLPSTLIPIRIDVEIPPYVPLAPLGPPIGPTPGAHPSHNAQFDMTNPLNRQSDVTVPYRLKDTFLWNLHETLITTDQFAITMTQDLDLPIRNNVAAEISKQIRTQLEEYAGVALHPLFHPTTATAAPAPAASTATPAAAAAAGQRDSATPAPHISSISRADTPLRNGLGRASTPSKAAQPATSAVEKNDVTAVATAISPESEDYNPDDTYRCIVNLNINLSSRLYTDKFEWSLLHPPGVAEAFAKQTCADLGLTGEWIPAMTHAIYEAVLRLKKEACESGGLVAGFGGGLGFSDFPNDAAVSYSTTAADSSGGAAGWRYDPDLLGDSWEPKVEILSKEEIEKREGDRERQLRRLRRETARFSSNTGMAGGLPMGFGFSGFGGLVEQEEERMGRGERTKKKRRFRSLSPNGRSGTPGGRGTPDAANTGTGGYGGGGSLADNERSAWRCTHCRVWGTSVWAVRDGPHGPRTLCNNCGYMYERDRKLPRWTKLLHANDSLLL